MDDETLDAFNQELPEEMTAIPEIKNSPEIEQVLDTEPPTPPLSEVDELLKISNETVADEAYLIDFDYKAGKDLEFSAKLNNFEKYYSYGSDTYGKFGFNPFLNGVDTDGDGEMDKTGMDDLYDRNTDFWDDWERSSEGMWELNKIGLADTYLFGAFHDDENYVSFGDVMKKYSTSKKGFGGFMNNTKLSAGYTMGIIEGIAAEELTLLALTGGAANIGTAGAELGRLGKGLQKAGQWMNRNKYLKVADELGDINKAKSWLGRRIDAVGKGAKGFARMANPLGDTINFIREADKLKEFTKLGRVVEGAASLTRDMRKIYLAHSEGKLEANMAEDEFRQEAWDEWYKMNPDAGIMGDDQLNLINAEAARVNANVYAGNFGLIYLTNAVTFNSLFRSGKLANRLMSRASNGLFKVTRNKSGKAIVQSIAKTPANYIRNKGWTWAGTAKESGKTFLTQSMEGVQELGQDILSDSFRNYHIRNTLGTQTQGGFYHYLTNDLVHSVEKQNSMQGLVTFGSGLFMGMFASPVSFANTQVTKFFQGGGYISAAGTYQKAFNNKEYKKNQKAEEKRLEEEAIVLTEFFNSNKTFIKSASLPIYRQVELEQEMLDAAEKNHVKDFKNAQHASLVNGARTLIDNGLVDEYIKQLEYFASDNYTTEDLQELFQRPDLTDKGAQEKRSQLLENAKMLGEIRDADAIIKRNLPNPHSLIGIKRGTANYSQTLYKHYAWKSLQQELIFNTAKIIDRKQRLESIKKLIGETSPLAAEMSVEALVDEDTLLDSIEILRAEVKANEDLNLTGEAALQALTTEKRLTALEKYHNALETYRFAFELDMTTKTRKSISNKSESEYYEDLFEAYNNLLKEYGLNKLSNLEAQKEINQKSFDLIFDYISLEAATGQYTNYVSILETTAGQNDFLNAREQVLERLDANKKVHIKNALRAFYEKKSADAMLDELFALGFFFDLNAIDSLVEDGIMPIEILDLNNDNQPVSDEQYMIAQEVMQKHIGHLVGKKLIRDKFEDKSQGRKLLSDKRTVSNILNEYGISLDTNIKLTGKKGKILLEALLNSKNKNLTRLDREILIKVIKGNDATLKFVSDQTLPIQINEAGVFTIDIRYAGEDYLNSAYSIENLITTALTQSKIINELKENDDLWLQTRMAMKQAKEIYAQAYPEENVEEMPVFNTVNVFLSEALNDRGFQDFLAQINDDIAPTKKSLWSTVKKGTAEILEKDFEGKLLNRVINIAAKAIDAEIVDSISEINIKARTEEDEASLDKKVVDLTVMANELALKWNVKVKVLKDQNEAQKYLDEIENPFYSKEDQIPAGFYDEKTNTAYIIAEDVKANTAMHEIFLHPFLINAEKENPELYKALVAEAKADQSVIDYVEKNFGKEEIIGTRQFEHELVGRVYDLALNNKISEKEKPGLFKRAYEFMKALLKSTGEFLRILPKDLAKFKPGKTTIKDLAEYSRSEQSGFNLGKVVLAPIRPKVKVEEEQTEKPEKTKTEKKPISEKVIEESLTEDDTLESINDKIENLEKQVAKLETLRLDGKLSIREKSRVKKKMLRLKMLINELDKKKLDLIKLENKKKDVLKVKDKVEFEADLDYNGNEIIVPEMPFSRLPNKLQIDLAEIYGKKVASLSEEDIDVINKERKSNPLYIAAVNEYVEQRLDRQDKILNEQEVKINQEKIDRAKAKRQAELNLDKKSGRKKQTIEDKIREMSSDLLTEKEIQKLANKIRNQEEALPFGFEDVRAFILNKKRIQEKKEKRKDAIQYAKDLAIERAKQKIIKGNIERLGKKGSYPAPILKSIDSKTGEKKYKRNDLMIPAGMRQFLVKYYPDLFLETNLEVFNQKLTTIIKQYKSDRNANYVLSKLKLEEMVQGTEQEILFKLANIVDQLDQEKKLYPVLVQRINAALNKANLNYTLKRLSGVRLANDSSLYGLFRTPNKVKGKEVYSPKKGRYTKASTVINKFEYSVDHPFMTLVEQAEIHFASEILEAGVFFPRSIFETLDRDATRQGRYDSLISEDPTTWLYNVSKNAEYTNLADKLVESFAGMIGLSIKELNIYLAEGGYEGTAGMNTVLNVLYDNFTKEAITNYYGKLIRDRQYQFEDEVDEDDFIIPEDMQSLVEYAIWSTSKEGKKYINTELKSLSKERSAFDEMIAEEYLNQKETPKQDVSYNYFEKDIADRLSKVKKVNKQLTILWDLLNKEKEGDLNFIKAYAAYAKDLNMSKAQRETSDNLIRAQFASGRVLGAIINLNGIAYVINDYLEENNKVQISLLQSDEADLTGYVEYLEFSPKSLLSQMTNELAAGSVFNLQLIDTVANSAEIQYIKDAYSDILTNFTEYNKEAESLSDDQLLKDLKTEITKCK